jgi:hypothetical protein
MLPLNRRKKDLCLGPVIGTQSSISMSNEYHIIYGAYGKTFHGTMAKSKLHHDLLPAADEITATLTSWQNVSFPDPTERKLVSDVSGDQHH